MSTPAVLSTMSSAAARFFGSETTERLHGQEAIDAVGDGSSEATQRGVHPVQRRRRWGSKITAGPHGQGAIVVTTPSAVPPDSLQCLGTRPSCPHEGLRDREPSGRLVVALALDSSTPPGRKSPEEKKADKFMKQQDRLMKQQERLMKQQESTRFALGWLNPHHALEDKKDQGDQVPLRVNRWTSNGRDDQKLAHAST